MTAPLAINVQCRDAQGNLFIGRRDTLLNIFPPDATEFARNLGSIHAPRWFKLKDKTWVVTDEPDEWEHCFGTDDQWINDEIEKADKL